MRTSSAPTPSPWTDSGEFPNSSKMRWNRLCIALAVRHVCLSHQTGTEQPVRFILGKIGMKALGGLAEKALQVRRRLEISRLGCFPRVASWVSSARLRVSWTRCLAVAEGLSEASISAVLLPSRPVQRTRRQPVADSVPRSSSTGRAGSPMSSSRSAKAPRTPANSSRLRRSSSSSGVNFRTISRDIAPCLPATVIIVCHGSGQRCGRNIPFSSHNDAAP